MNFGYGTLWTLAMENIWVTYLYWDSSISLILQSNVVSFFDVTNYICWSGEPI